MRDLKEFKAEVGAISEVGNRLDDMLDAARIDAARIDGAKTALTQAEKGIEALLEHVSKDVDAGTYSLVESKAAKVYLQRAAAVAGSLAQQYANKHLMAQGKVQMGEHNIKVAKKLLNEKHAVMDREIDALSKPNVVPIDASSRKQARKAGEAPAAGIKARRQAEAASVKKSKRGKKPDAKNTRPQAR